MNGLKKCLLLTLLGVLPVTATLTFETTSRDVHAEVDQRLAKCEYRFTNTGDKPVRIARFDSSCACLTVQVAGGKRDYAAGEEGVIRAVFDLGNATGEVEKIVQIWLDDDPPLEPSVRLTARLHIPELVQIEPKTLHWKVDPTEAPSPQTLAIRIDHDEPIHIQKVESSRDDFEVRLRELEAGRSYEIDVEPKSLAKPALGVIYIRTDAKHERFQLQRAFAVVRKPLNR
jgi:hypothetical protein